MRNTTIGNLLVDRALPEKYRRGSYNLDKKGIEALLEPISQEMDPDEYKLVLQRLNVLGQRTAIESGTSISLSSLKKGPKSQAIIQSIKDQVRAIQINPKLSAGAKNQQIIDLLTNNITTIRDTIYNEGLEAESPFAIQAKSGSRGNANQLMQLVAGDGMVADFKQRPVPVPILTGYAEGVSPAEYFAGSYGARQGSASAKLSTAQSGAALKQLVQSTHKVVVTEEDCGTDNGLPTEANDPDNEGALLARPFNGIAKDTPITSKFIKSSTGTVIVRSPLTCQAKYGVCAKCAGLRERGRLPNIGDNLGIPASQALGEKITQGALSAKHGGGQVKGKRIEAAGFKFIEGLMQSNANINGLATVAEVDGKVKAVVPAPQGGHYVQFDDDQYYVPIEQNPIVKAGDIVEAGDMVSDGVPDPSAVTRLKGIGEGRKMFTKIFTEAFRNSGHEANRRNVELIARGLINHVQITDPNGVGDYLPDDVVNYDDLMRNWTPRQGTKKYSPNLAKNKYLERPALNYTVGTRISPKIAADLEYNKVKEVEAHDDPPPFEPINVRALENAYRDSNWMTRMVGSYLERGFSDAVNRGSTAQLHTQSYAPSLAEGVNFGKDLKTKGVY